ncbi:MULTISPECIES: serine/threonine-protein kinase [unclassified Streptomyces]|uniref:serine/threonine-protein kinase n=1 Tax=unclassified Streptomyces TaxID=2593676 RepID=UPI001BE704A1|nr:MULTISPECIES: serine/threonine-protein kinase [unclassified Streptomyces]MBT2406545.1 protein kinase [Streptomyces sp. ISL-21]MBT2608883.1 protein kinase [Streptomyces sp. ISL-87]
MTAGEANGGELIGRLLGGRYRVTAVIGRGGMGVVARAVDEMLNREVAVKIMRAYTDTSGAELADLRVRMQREAQAAARIRHTGVVTVHDVTEDQGLPVIVMELVDGPSLDDVLTKGGPLEPREAAAIGAKLMDALDAAHQAGVLHRDVKPGNVLLERNGRVVLTDFGIATLEAAGDEAMSKLTRSGELVGSLDYLPPERAQGQEPGPASDIWSLGMTLYAAVEGTSPFRRTSAWSTLAAIVTEPLPEARRAGPLAPVLQALMAKEPANRPAAGQAREMLEQVAAGGTMNFAPAAPPVAPVPTTPSVGPAVVPPPPPGYGAPYSQPSPQQPYAAHPAPQSPYPGHPAPQPPPYAGHQAPQPPYAGHPAPQPPYAGHPAPPTPYAGQPNTVPQTGAPAAGRASGDRPRGRSRTVIAASAAAVVLAGGGITYAMVGDNGAARADTTHTAQPQLTPAPSSSPSSSGKPSATPSAKPGKTKGKAPTATPSGAAPQTSAPSTAKPSPVSTSCTGWSHKEASSGSYGYMSGNFHIVTGPYQSCPSVSMAKTGTKLLFHCYIVNAYGNKWTYVRMASANTSGWMSYDNLTRQSGTSAPC